MRNTRWYLSITHRLLEGGPHYNAVRVNEKGQTIECDMPPTKHRHIAERRVMTLNNQDALMQVALSGRLGGK